MARRGAALLAALPLARSLRSVPAADGGWAVRRTLALEADLVELVLEHVPRPLMVASSSGGRTARLWQAASPSGDEIERRLHGHPDYIISVQFFPQGDRLITSSVDGTTFVWAAPTGQRLETFRHGHTPRVELFQVQVFPDGDRLVTIASDCQSVIWSIQKAGALTNISSHGEGCHESVRVSRQGDRVVTGVNSVDTDPAIIWNTTDGRQLLALRHDRGRIRFLDMTPCGEKVATSGAHVTCIWSSTTGVLERCLPKSNGWLVEIAVSPGGAIILDSAWNSVVLRDGRFGGEDVAALNMGEIVTAFGFLADEALLLAFSRNTGVVWDVGSGMFVQELVGGVVGEAEAISFTAGTAAACGSPRDERDSDDWGQIWTTVWDLASGKVLRQLMEPSIQWAPWFCKVAVSPPGTMREWLPG